MSDSPDPYDAIPYESSAYPQSHPDHMAVIAELFGMQPRGLENARVLEIGCAGGGNLLPLAAAYPGSRFVGVDLSARQIAEADQGVAGLRLDNIHFHAMGLEAIGTTFGTFDYIIAHGVYSWVQAPVRELLLALCSRLLEPEGVAYVSYNTLPGASTRVALREMLRFHTRQAVDAADRLVRARAYLAFMEGALRDREDSYARAMAEELAQLAGSGDFYISHEYLEESGDACYFHEFMSQAQRHGLQFLAEAEVWSLSSAGLPPSVRTALRGMAHQVEESEQYRDFVRNRAFRQTLLCHAGIEVKRAISPELVQRFRMASCFEPVAAAGGDAAQFRDADGRVLEVPDALTAAALRELHAVWPKALPFAELLADAAGRLAMPAGPREAAVLSHGLLGCYAASRSLELQQQPRPFHAAVSRFPQASPLSRWQASRGLRVTNQRHENVLLRPEEKEVLLKLDGQHAVDDLTRRFPDAQPLLEYFARIALLVS